MCEETKKLFQYELIVYHQITNQTMHSTLYNQHPSSSPRYDVMLFYVTKIVHNRQALWLLHCVLFSQPCHHTWSHTMYVRTKERKCTLPFSHPIKLNFISMSISSSPPLILTFCRKQEQKHYRHIPQEKFLTWSKKENVSVCYCCSLHSSSTQNQFSYLCT